MDKHLISGRVENIAATVAAASGVELVHVEISGTKRDVVVRLYIDKPDGGTIEACSLVSSTIEYIL